MSKPSTYHLRKAKEIILVGYYHFGHRLNSHFLYRPLHDLYLFLRGSHHTASLVGTHDLCFLEVFCYGNKYAQLLGLDVYGSVRYDEATEVPIISVGEAFECAIEMEKWGYELLGEMVRRILRVPAFEWYCGAREVELAVAGGVAYS